MLSDVPLISIVVGSAADVNAGLTTVADNVISEIDCPPEIKDRDVTRLVFAPDAPVSVCERQKVGINRNVRTSRTLRRRFMMPPLSTIPGEVPLWGGTIGENQTSARKFLMLFHFRNFDQ